ncbi:wurmchen 2 transmembrane micropeptide [Choristoneura fumiferana]|uniref:wurmchen 2 transmembrane micropeptide n=1 Tax=Choristoneura fumiferana TaxID=7141 RepID=UPI003D158D69
MAFLMLYPAVAVLSLFVLMVIIVILRFGAQCCKLRHHALPVQHAVVQGYWREDEAYEQKVSYA